MRKNPTPAELDEAVAATMRGLPDSITKRKAALVSLLWLLPTTYPRRDEIGEALHGLHIHEAAQARFPFAEGKELR